MPNPVENFGYIKSGANPDKITNQLTILVHKESAPQKFMTLLFLYYCSNCLL